MRPDPHPPPPASEREFRLALTGWLPAQLFQGGDFRVAEPLTVEEHAPVLLHVDPPDMDVGLEQGGAGGNAEAAQVGCGVERDRLGHPDLRRRIEVGRRHLAPARVDAGLVGDARRRLVLDQPAAVDAADRHLLGHRRPGENRQAGCEAELLHA